MCGCGCGAQWSSTDGAVPVQVDPSLARCTQQKSEQWPRRLHPRPAKHRNPHRPPLSSRTHARSRTRTQGRRRRRRIRGWHRSHQYASHTHRRGEARVWSAGWSCVNSYGGRTVLSDSWSGLWTFRISDSPTAYRATAYVMRAREGHARRQPAGRPWTAAKTWRRRGARIGDTQVGAWQGIQVAKPNSRSSKARRLQRRDSNTCTGPFPRSLPSQSHRSMVIRAQGSRQPRAFTRPSTRSHHDAGPSTVIY
jgi:hypothetical protein